MIIQKCSEVLFVPPPKKNPPTRIYSQVYPLIQKATITTCGKTILSDGSYLKIKFCSKFFPGQNQITQTGISTPGTAFPHRAFKVFTEDMAPGFVNEDESQSSCETDHQAICSPSSTRRMKVKK